MSITTRQEGKDASMLLKMGSGWTEMQAGGCKGAQNTFGHVNVDESHL